MPTAPHMYAASASQTASPPQKIHLSESPRLEAALATRDGSCAETRQWQALSLEEKERVYELMYVLDRFCISDDAYHELTLHSAGMALPRSYLVKQARKDLIDLQAIEFISKPGIKGARLSFSNTVWEEIRLFFSRTPGSF